MSWPRLRTVIACDLRFHFKRPLMWILLFVLALMALGLSTGNVAIQSGDSTVGGESKAWLTSEFAIGMIFPVTAFFIYLFFIAVAAGMTVPRDDELRVSPIIHATKLTPGEYIWGKFLAVALVFTVVLVVHAFLQMFFNHLWPHADAERIRGPFQLANYLRPAFIMTLPCVLFFAGAAFALGERTRSPILIYVAPVIAFLIAFFLLDWAPTWLDPTVAQALMWLEPSGFRWINETWLKLDRGVDFYNTQPVGYDAPFLLSRFAYLALGLVFVQASARRFAKTVRGTQKVRGAAIAPPAVAPEPVGNLASLGMATRLPGFVRTVLEVARFEAANLRSQPGLYLFAPIILLQAILSQLFQVGSFGTPLLLTAGAAAVGQMGTLTVLVCLLLMFYTVESVTREWNAGLAQIYFATPARTAAMLLGKSIANGFVGIIILLGALFGSFFVVLTHQSGWLSFLPLWGMSAAVLIVALVIRGIVVRRRSAPAAPSLTRLERTIWGFLRTLGWIGLGIIVAVLPSFVIFLTQGVIDFSLIPFALVWGLLLFPTFIVWATFVTAVFAIVGNRYTTYAIALGAIVYTFWKNAMGEMNWVGNWGLWGVATWSDFGSVQPNDVAMLLNRLFYLAVMAFLVALTVRIFPRREHDSARIVDRLRLRFLGRTMLRLAPAGVPAIALGFMLNARVSSGWEGPAAVERHEHYWGRNIATWPEADTPQVGGVDLDLTLEPRDRYFRVTGWYDLVNWTDEPMRRFPMSVGDHFRNIEWTVGGEEFDPEDRAKLHVFELDEPIAPGDTLRVGFSHEGYFPDGLNKNGGGMDNFILPAGVVLTSFTTGFVPVPYFEEERGVPEETEIEAKDFDPDHFEGITPPALGSGVRFPVRTKITGPSEYAYHGVGVKAEETVEEGRRTVVWETDFPVNFFNVVAGKWAVWEGEGATVYYHPDHTYNIDEIGETLVASRQRYSEWFYPYPWQDLRLNEFAGVANYAQGFPTNITFSENIGFLTRNTKEVDATFLVTAHEAAHQWWGNIVMPGEGPGGNILSEGMAHFSTVLLFGDVKGEEERIEFCKRIEENYGDQRSVDTEKPLVRTMGDKGSDTTVMYDKGGWVFWMLHRLMGEEASFAGIRDFIEQYQGGPDFPVLEDFVRVMRTHAPDPEAFDAFVDQWFFDVVVPEYEIVDARREETSGRWTVTARVENRGTGAMPVEVCACRGERFGEEADWEETRVSVTLAAGESREVTVECGFEPEKVVVDPDAVVLMLERQKAEVDL